MKLLPALAVALAVALATRAPVAADPLRLRADALASTASPAGLLVLDASGAAQPGLSAEAVVWVAGNTGTDSMHGDDSRGDVLVVAVDARTASGAAAARVGRFVSVLGALRPEHVDGGSVRLRLPYHVDVEAVGGIPVMPGLTMDRSWDWLAGGRIARRFGDWGSAGIAYEQRRDDGGLVTEEVAADRRRLARPPRRRRGARRLRRREPRARRGLAVREPSQRAPARRALRQPPRVVAPAAGDLAVLGDRRRPVAARRRRADLGARRRGST